MLKFLETKPNIHWQTEAATAMAEVGDVRESRRWPSACAWIR